PLIAVDPLRKVLKCSLVVGRTDLPGFPAHFADSSLRFFGSFLPLVFVEDVLGGRVSWDTIRGWRCFRRSSICVGNQGARRYAFERTYRIDTHLSLCFLKRTGCILACLFLLSGCSFLKLSTRHLGGAYFRRVTPASVALCRARGLLQRDGQE